MQLYFFAEFKVHSYAETEIFSMRGNVLHHSQRPDYNTGKKHFTRKGYSHKWNVPNCPGSCEAWRRVMP